MRRENEFRYTQLANILREQIVSGYIKPGDFLMSENELCKHYNLSRTSVRKSLEELLKEGLIVKRAGQGTMVSPTLIISKSLRRVIRILAPSPSHFVNNGMPIIIEEFQKRYPNVDVKILSFPAVNFWESLRTSHELGVFPDLLFVHDRQYFDVEHKETFINMSEILHEPLQLMYPRLLEAFRSSRAITAVPITFSTVYLAYNPILFERYGVEKPHSRWTLDDFIRAAKALTHDTDGDGIVDTYGFTLSSELSRWPVIALQNGVNFQEHDVSTPILKTLELIHELLYKQKTAALYQPTTHRINSEAFMNGKTAMVLTTSIELSGWRDEGLAFEPQVASLPFGETLSTLLVANAFMIPSTCNDVLLASAFVQTALDLQVQELIGKQAHYLSCLHPINSKQWDRSFLESLNIVNSDIRNSYFVHEMFGESAALSEMENEMELYWSGMESAESMAKRLSHMVHNR